VIDELFRAQHTVERFSHVQPVEDSSSSFILNLCCQPTDAAGDEFRKTTSLFPLFSLGKTFFEFRNVDSSRSWSGRNTRLSASTTSVDQVKDVKERTEKF
jgi:hypothetical protein